MSNKDSESSNGKKKLMDDAIKSLIPTIIPMLAEKLLELIPAGSKLNDALSKIKDYPEKIAPLLTYAILYYTDMPDTYEFLLAEVNAELGRAIHEKYSSEKTGVDGFIELLKHEAKKTKEKKEKIIFLAGSLETTRLQDFLKLVNAITDDKQKVKFLNYLLPLDSGAATIESWTRLDEDSFKLIVRVLMPEIEEKKEKWLEEELKKVASGAKLKIEELKTSYKESLARPTLLERFAKFIDFFGIMK